MIEFSSPDLVAPDGSIIGVIEEGTAWVCHAVVCDVIEVLPDKAGNYVLAHPFSKSDGVYKARGISRMLEQRRAGGTLVLLTYDEALLERCADEIWWLRDRTSDRARRSR